MSKKIVFFVLPIIMLMTAFTVQAAAAKTNTDTYNLLKKALSNQYYKTLGQIGRSATYDYIVNHSKITLATAENIYPLSVPNQLTSFKSEFLADHDSEFNDREKIAIKNAFVNRFLDLCNRSNDAALKTVVAQYNKELAVLTKTRVDAVKACNITFNTAVKLLSKSNGNNYFINSEELRMVKETCASSAYVAFNTVANTLIADVKTKSAYTDYNTCATSDLITAWDWQ